MDKNKSKSKSKSEAANKKAGKASKEAIVPYTIDAVVQFVAERYDIPVDALSGKRAPAACPQIGGPCIVVQAKGKDFLGVLPLAEKERNLRGGLLDMIESGELSGGGICPDLLEDVPIGDILKVVAEHSDLRGLREWVSVNSNQEVMEPGSTDAFWSMWNSCGLKPLVKLGGTDRISPSFSMMKRLQSARRKKLLNLPLEYLLHRLVQLDPEPDVPTAAIDIILQECRSFDWKSMIDGFVELLGGVEGWMEGSCHEITRGLVIYRL